MSLDLEAIELIKRLKYRYCKAIDSCDTALLATLFTEDAAIDYRGGSYLFQAEGRDAIVVAIGQAFHDRFVSCHTVHHPIIDVHGDGTADGEWRLVDYAMDLGADNRVTLGAATYVDRYVLETDGWKIARSGYTRIYERVFHEPDPAVTFYQLDPANRAR